MNACTRCVTGCAAAAFPKAGSRGLASAAAAAVPFHYSPLFQHSKEPKCQFRRLDTLSNGVYRRFNAYLHAWMHANPCLFVQPHRANSVIAAIAWPPCYLLSAASPELQLHDFKLSLSPSPTPWRACKRTMIHLCVPCAVAPSQRLEQKM